MTLPFLDLLKKLTGRPRTVIEEMPPGPVTSTRVPKKPASERLSKTVLPHATRSFSAPDPFRSAAVATSGRTMATPMQLGSQHITAASKKSQGSPLPPALARALEPKLERTISLRIADIIDRVPAGYMKPVEILDSAARVSLKASEIEKGMPEKNPSIALPSLYQQVPEIFLKGVRPDDDTRVVLPYDKVLAQFTGAQVRADQTRDPAVPQLDTPILKATIQDSEKFGTKIEPIETSALPSVPVKTATAEAIAEAEPDAVVQGTIKLKPAPPHPVVSLYSPPLKPKSEPPGPPNSPSRTGTPSPSGTIPFQLSPNGTGVSASERVPASSGPPVPTPLPFTPELTKIPFTSPLEKPKAPETKTPSEPSLKFSLTPTAKPESKPLPLKEETLIKLSLKTVFQNLPAFQLNGDIAAVADDAEISLPLSMVESQLASGRVSVSPAVFESALPEKYRQMFEIDEAGTLVALPLEEVLKNLPATILKLRDDQERATLDTDFETPFSIKAKEDAERFATGKTPAEKTPEKPKAEPTAEKTPEKPKEEPKVAPKIDITPPIEKKIEPKTEEKVDPKEIVAQATALPGVKACAITFSDGLSLAGELPAEISAEGLCAMAPSIFERVAQHVGATKLGPLAALTLYTNSSAITFFARKNICLAALHAEDSLPPKTRTEIAGLVEKLSSTYTQPEK